MISNAAINSHPGKMLDQHYFQPRKLTIYRVAKDTGISKAALCGILTGKQRLEVKEAVMLARYFGEVDDLFAKIQLEHDLQLEQANLKAQDQ